jgi:dTDP-4-amino-4,6-dideoxygalactose transaminase
MKVPLLDLKPHHDPIIGEIEKAVKEVIDSNYFILGPKVEEFEKNAAKYFDAKYALGVSSGTDALMIALMAIDLKPSDEVIIPAYSFFATAGVIARMNAKPVFVDIDPVTYNINPAKIEEKITPKTKAIIPVHLYGQCADMEPIIRIAKKHNLTVIEDAAQAIGAQYKDGRKACTIGDMGCLSFFPSKNLGAFGDAGMVITNDEKLYEKLHILRVHGAQQKYYHKIVGGNFRIDAIQAAVLNIKLKHLDNWTKQRQQNAQNYRRLFEEAKLSDTIKLPQEVYKNLTHGHIYNQFVARFPKRDELQKFLADNEIGSAVYYPIPFHLLECFKYLGYKEGDFPESEKAAKETLALPIYQGLTQDMQKFAVEKIKEFYTGEKK